MRGDFSIRHPATFGERSRGIPLHRPYSKRIDLKPRTKSDQERFFDFGEKFDLGSYNC